MEGLRRIALRIQHDCPLAALSADHPGVDLEVWGGHRVEVVVARGRGLDRFADAAEERLRPLRTLPLEDGLVIVWRPTGDGKSSVSRRLEAHGLMWLQPLRVSGGWERWDAVAFGEDGGQGAIDDLRAEHEVLVERRDTIAAGDLVAGLFLSLGPVLEAPTPKQAEALLAAFDGGYYGSPRGATTADVAGALGIGRSAFEERLRGGENRLMAAVLPAMRHQADRAARHTTGKEASSLLKSALHGL